MNAAQNQHERLKLLGSFKLLSFIVFSSEEYIQMWNARLFYDYMLFTIEADIKGKPQYLWYEEFI